MSFTQATAADIVFHFKPGCYPPIELEILNPQMVGLRPSVISPFALQMQKAQTMPEPEPCTTLIHDPSLEDQRGAKRARIDYMIDTYPFTPYLYEAPDKVHIVPPSPPEPEPTLPAQAHIVAKWTNSLTNNPKWIYHEAYPDNKNSIEIKLTPHSNNKGILTVILHDQFANDVVVYNSTYKCYERTYTNRKNAITFHYVLSYCEEHLIEATHKPFAGRSIVNKFKLIPSKTYIGWNISTPIVA